jgi:2-polyprenyl-3-methyl-5-hydroxy-6-metoxy-1,4-benzoquinol methylase
MFTDIQRWLEHDGVLFFKELGLLGGEKVLDFGCGGGNYAIPAAITVGSCGSVYALDGNRCVLENLMTKASSFGTSNIVPVNNLEELAQVLAGVLLDAVLFYDVIHSYYFTRSERERLLTSIGAMLSPGGLVSIFPKHMSRVERNLIVESLERRSIYLENEGSCNLVHDGRCELGHVMNFRKLL